MNFFKKIFVKKEKKVESVTIEKPTNQNALFVCDYCKGDIFLHDKINKNIITKDNKKYHKRCWRKNLKRAKKYISNGSI